VCLHSTPPEDSLHCTFEFRISKAGLFEVLKAVREHYDVDLAKKWWDGPESRTPRESPLLDSPYFVYPFIFKIVGVNTLHMAMGDFGETRRIAIFTLHDDCPKGMPGVQVHVAVWLIGPDGFTPIESSNDAAEAYLYFKDLLQGAREPSTVTHILTYNGPSTESNEQDGVTDAPTMAPEAPSVPADASEPQKGTSGRDEDALAA